MKEIMQIVLFYKIKRQLLIYNHHKLKILIEEDRINMGDYIQEGKLRQLRNLLHKIKEVESL